MAIEKNYFFTAKNGDPGWVIVSFVDDGYEYRLALENSETLGEEISNNYDYYLDLAKQSTYHDDPTRLDRIEAQTLYTALETDTLLEG